MSGALFSPFRALGYITDSVPFAVQRRGAATFLTVSVGKAWQIYNTDKLRLALVGPQLKHAITALACKGDLTFTATRDGAILEHRRVHASGAYAAGGHEGEVLQLLVLGDRLLSLGADRRLLVWRIGEYAAPEVAVQLGSDFTPTCLAHPDTYLNKVVVGSADGRLQLWNFSTARLLYTFPGWGSAVRCLVPSPALDVVGVGLGDGRAILHNLRYDDTLLTLHNAAGAGTNADRFLTGSDAQAAALAAPAAVTTLAFRTGTGVPLMAAGGPAGVITVWNLEARRMHTLIKDAHDSSLVALHFFAGEPLLMSAGTDNAVKQWVFDAVDGAARLLKFRSGHAAPPTVVRHYGAGCLLLSAGEDRAFRAFSTIQDAQSRELSQHHTARRAKRLKIDEQELKLSAVTALDACDVRERDWSNVVTAHAGDTRAYVWRLQNYALGEWVLFPPGKQLAGAPETQVTSVCLSRCGNFGFVGSEGGRLDRYNMQSGLHRGSYCRAPKLMQEAIRKSAPGVPAPTALLSDPGLTAHSGPITGVCSDSCNRLVVTAGADGYVRVWDFRKRSLKAEIKVGVPITRLACHPGTGLMAAACADNAIRMFDLEAAHLVRQFRGHTAPINDMLVSDDCRWLLSASADGTVRCWDIPGARVLQVMRLGGGAVTSLSLGPQQDLLATAHAGRRGIYLWANQMLFGSGADILPSEAAVWVRLPDAAGSGDGAFSSSDSDEAHEEAEEEEQQQQQGAAGKRQQAQQSARRQQGEAAEAAALDPAAAAAAGAGYAARDGAGAPTPLAPTLATLSMLPRTQWQNLVHLDTIKARNKPMEPPTKPAAAPFFLPTLAGVNSGRNPVFDYERPPLGGEADAGADAAVIGGGGGEAAADAALAAKAAAAWGDDADEELGDAEEEERRQDGAADAAAPAGRVLRTRMQAEHSPLVRLLRACGAAGNWTSLVAHLRGLSPVALDSEIRSMQVLEGAPQQELDDLALLLQFLEEETGGQRNFEFVQALLRVTLQVHGETIAGHAGLAEVASLAQERLGAAWRRLDGLMQSVRCMVGFLGNLQA